MVAATTALATVRELPRLLPAYLICSDSTLLPVASVHRGLCLSAHLFKSTTVLCAKLILSQFSTVYLSVVTIVPRWTHC